MVLDLKLTGMTSLTVRIAAGGAMAIGCLLARNYGSDMWRTMLWLGLSAGYIMLFTPMNEANSYVILAPSLGLWAWWHFENGSPWTAKFIGLMCVVNIKSIKVRRADVADFFRGYSFSVR